jgi:hypothetical protein
MNKTIYVSDVELWERAKAQAEQDQLSISAVIAVLLRVYVNMPKGKP